MRSAILLSLCAFTALNGQQYTKGVGIYPGDPKQDFAPAVAPERAAAAQTVRNLALRRPAYQSSAYDYKPHGPVGDRRHQGDETAALVHRDRERTAACSPNRSESIQLITNNTTSVRIGGDTRWIQFELAGGDSPLEVDRIDISVAVAGLAAAAARAARSPPMWPPALTMGRRGRNSAATFRHRRRQPRRLRRRPREPRRCRAQAAAASRPHRPSR